MSWLCLTSCLLANDGQQSVEFKRGQQIYVENCAACHGDFAEGVEGIYDSPLEGDLPVGELAKYVDETMPEDDPSACSGADAELVSLYLHQAFYSRRARLRNNPPKIEFSRRTVGQFQNAVADIMKQLKWEGDPYAKERGLNAKYFETRQLGKGKPAVEKVEPEIDFDFGEEPPYPDILKDKTQFSAEWRGGLFAKETGIYEFIVTSQNGFRLSVNGQEYTIDNQVNSTDQTEFKSTVRLIGGQPYPFSLTMFKFNEVVASMKLEWIPPGGVRQVIPKEVLTPGYFSPVLVFNTQFPADDSSVGYARGTTISQQWDNATTAATIEAMTFVDEHLEEMMNQTVGKEKRRKKRNKNKDDQYNADKNKDDKKDQPKEEETEAQRDAKRLERVRTFATKFVTIAFGRDLTSDEKKAFIDAQFARESNPTVAMKRVILLTLKSPQFLYISQFDRKTANSADGGATDNAAQQSAVANVLATVLWDSIPDKALRAAAAKGALKDRKAIENYAWGMLDRPRTRQKLSDFLFRWLEMEKASHASKDEQIYPGFDQSLIYSLKKSIDRSLDDIIWSEKSDFRELFLFDQIYVDQRIANFYEIDLGTGDAFAKVSFESDRRCGILTHPYLMTGLAYYKNTSPIHRGVFIAKSLLGRTLKAPTIDVEPLGEDFDPSMTTRERVAHQTKEVSCKGCHSVINPLGFSLENFDAVGRFRDQEKDKPIDAKTVYITPEAKEVSFSGAKDLADFLVSSPDAHRNFIEKLFQHFVKQPVYAFGPDTLDQLYQGFVQSDYNVRQLIVRIAVVAANDVSLKNGISPEAPK